MSRLRFAGAAGAAILATALIAAGPRPAALANAAPGQWEIAGLPGAKAPARQCISDPIALSQFEHGGRNCNRTIISDSPSSAVVEYNCKAAGFGRSKMTVITPRSLRIETQGISEGLPFNYVMQARRIGDCPVKQTAAAH
jgi:hypothetical protein